MSTDKNLLTIKDVTDELGVNERTVRRWLKSGELQYTSRDIRWRGYLISREQLDAFIAERTKKPEQP